MEDKLEKTIIERFNFHKNSVRLSYENKRLKQQIKTLLPARQVDLQQMMVVQKKFNAIITARQADLQQCQRPLEVITIEDLHEEDGTHWVENYDKEDDYIYSRYFRK